MNSFNAFEWIQDALAEELAKQGFGAPEPLEDKDGKAVAFTTEEVAYSLLYEQKRQRFVLRSAMISESGELETWRSLSTWLYDEETGERSDAESILNDFLDVVRGPKRVAAVAQQKRKRGKDDERNVDPMFFFNRLVNVFPELKDELNEEKIVYGQVRPVTFLKEHVAERCEDLAVKYPESEPFQKLCALLDDMYKNGDMDVRSIVTVALLNRMSDPAFEAFQSHVGDELKTDLKYTRRLKDKKIKPEKKKKQAKVEARLES